MPGTIAPPKKPVDPVVAECLLADEPRGAALVLLQSNVGIAFNYAQRRQIAREIQNACQTIKGLPALPTLIKNLDLAREREARETAEIDAAIAELQSRKAALSATSEGLDAQARKHSHLRNMIESLLAQGGFAEEIGLATAAMRREIGL